LSISAARLQFSERSLRWVIGSWLIFWKEKSTEFVCETVSFRRGVASGFELRRLNINANFLIYISE
jgi:hypothetical protein